MGVSNVADTPIFEQLLRQSGMARAAADGGSRPERPNSTLGPADAPAAKIVVAGVAGVGKTTFIGSVSEIAPLGEVGTTAGDDPVDPRGEPEATDFGRLALHPDVVLHLVGTREPPTSWPAAVLGAVVLVDPRRIEDSFPIIDCVESEPDLAFVVVANMFDGRLAHNLDELREALALPPEVLLTTCDARDPGSTAKVLLELVAHTKNRTGS